MKKLTRQKRSPGIGGIGTLKGEVKRLVRKATKDEGYQCHRTSPPYRILVKHQSYNRKVMPGEIGAFLSTADGFGTFFPDKGGVVMKVPVKHIVRIDQSPAPSKRVVRKAIPIPAAAKPMRKLRRR
jgi:hypothetical protein